MNKYTDKNIEEWRESHIDKYKEMRWNGWIFVILPILFLILIWIFGDWSLKGKIIWTIIIVVTIYLFGIFRIREANKELKKFKNGII